MIIHVNDTETVPEVEGTLFGMVQQSVNSLVTLKNTGSNTMNYRFQEYNGATWVDIGVSGSDTYNTIASLAVVTLELTSALQQVRLVGNASGGAFLEFSITWHVTRPSGGNIPTAIAC